MDSHQHFWRLARGDYTWLTPALGAIHRDFGPDDLAPILARHGIARTILVQAAPTEAETRWLVEVARDTPFVAGVVGWTDFDAPDAAEAVGRLAGERALVGLRPMVQDIADDDWLARRDLAPVFDAMVAHGLVFDALVLPRHLTRLAAVVERHPGLQIVVDHGAKPRIREREIDAWRADLAAVASHPRVVCKLSGLVTEARSGDDAAELAPWIDALVDLFGPGRLLWGSDWPVVNLAGGYDRWRALTLRALDDLSPPQRAAVLGGNAARVYLGRPAAA
ncbi:MAG: amidohydrolase family protein [Burkholderiales bacterium]|nr:amidohydrolase family protein [Burkholderiales bacterium]